MTYKTSFWLLACAAMWSCGGAALEAAPVTRVGDSLMLQTHGLSLYRLKGGAYEIGSAAGSRRRMCSPRT